MQIMRFVENFSKERMIQEFVYNSRFTVISMTKDKELVELEPSEQYTYITLNKVKIPAVVIWIELYSTYMKITYHPADSEELVVQIPYNDIQSMELQTP